MPQITKEQVFQLATTQDIWKVHVLESERGWGSDSWDVFYDSYQEAYDFYLDTIEDLPKDHVPDYYITASAPEKVALKIA
jgi:hypothetical protein